MFIKNIYTLFSCKYIIVLVFDFYYYFCSSLVIQKHRLKGCLPVLRTTNRKVGIVLFIISIAYLLLSYNLPDYPYVPVDADAVPLVLGFLLLILSVSLFFQKDEEQNDESKTIQKSGLKEVGMLILIAVYIFLYILLLEPLGFVIISALFIFASTLSLGYKRNIINLIVSLTIPLLFYFAFNYGLKIVLPRGILPF